jgi:hypothetical protein
VGDPQQGKWSSVVDWPLIAIHAALLPDGRVMTYGTQMSRSGDGQFVYDIFDPAKALGTSESHLTLPNTTSTFLFCSAQVLLPLTGELLLAGGDIYRNGTLLNRGVADVNVFSPSNNRLTPAAPMKRPRWYATTTVLPSGEIYVQGGLDGEDHPEIRGDGGTFKLLEGVNTLKTLPTGEGYFNNDYPRNFVGPSGRIFGLDHHWMYEIDPYGIGDDGKAGSLKMFQAHWDIPNTRGGDSYRGWSATSSAVMYRPGKILQLGGTQANATSIDINGPAPVLTDLPPMSQTREWANATVMPDGKVFVSGGSSKNLLRDPANQDAGEPWYDTEIFDPRTGAWSQAAPLSVRRFYHSVALLLTDGTILSSGGGSPGPVTNLNSQIYSPAYLFADDGSLAQRPVIDEVAGALPTVVNPGSTFDVSSPDAASLARVTMVKTGSVTHSFDMDQRFVEPAFTVSGGQVRIQLPANQYETPPGFYMIFLINQRGTPSKAKMIRINPAR